MLNCVVYFVGTGFLLFIFGRLIPLEWMRWDKFPYRPYAFEKEGEIYKNLRIQRWQDKMPDMSRIFCKWMPPKRMVNTAKETLLIMIRETCIAELIHKVLCLTGLHCIRLWRGWGGIVMALLNMMVNLLFVWIQRYNRPRLTRLYQRQLEKEMKRNACQF